MHTKTLEMNISETSNTEITDPQYMKLNSDWVLWSHNMVLNDWSLNGYEKLFSIANISEFWKIMNNLEQIGLNCMHLYIMREGVTPIWEDENNRDGGICSFKIDYHKSLELIERLCAEMILENLIHDENNNKIINEINGISISPKINARNNWVIVKIWNKNNTHDTSKLLNKVIVDMCKGISIIYKSNKPEY
jgi:hypothetical protein